MDADSSSTSASTSTSNSMTISPLRVDQQERALNLTSTSVVQTSHATPTLSQPPNTPFSTSRATIPGLAATPTPFPLQITEELTFELVDQEFGATGSVAVVDQTAYLGVGLRLVLLDISRPATPRRIGQSQVLPGTVSAVLVRDGNAYVGAGNHLVVLNVAAPSAVFPVAELELPAAVTRLVLTDAVLIAGMSIFPVSPAGEDTAGLVAAIDVSENTSPKVLSSVKIPQSIEGMTTSDSIVYVGNEGSSTIYTVDISQPTQLPEPEMISGIAAQPGSLPLGEDLALFGDKLVTGGNYFVTLWNIADPLKPEVIWQSELVDGAVVEFEVRDGIIYLQSGYGVRAFIVPDLRGEEERTSVSTSIVVQDDRLIVANFGLSIYTIADQEDVKLLGAYNVPQVTDSALAGTTGFVIDRRNPADATGNRIITFRLPEIAILGEYVDEKRCSNCDATLEDVALIEDIAYVSAWEDGLRILDLSDTAQPALLASFGASDGGFTWFRVHDMAVVETRGYVVGLTNNERPTLLLLDLSDANSPHLLRAIPLQGSPERVAATENVMYIYTTQYTDRQVYTLYRLSLGGEEPEPGGSLELASEVHDIALYGDVALIASADGLAVISAELGGEQPVMIAQLQIPGGLWELALMDNILFATTAEIWRSGHLLAIDLQEISHPRGVGTLEFANGRAELAAADGVVIVGHASMGLVVLEVMGE